MLINARPHHTLCCLHKHKCLPARGGGLIKDIHILSPGTSEHCPSLNIVTGKNDDDEVDKRERDDVLVNISNSSFDDQYQLPGVQ